jgi:hypothetical protein
VHVVANGASVDPEWIPCLVTVHVRPFQGEFALDVYRGALHKLRDDLQRLSSDLTGSASFGNLEPTFSLEIQGDGRGHFQVAGELGPGWPGPTLAFVLEIDQTFLPPIVRDLDGVLS